MKAVIRKWLGIITMAVGVLAIVIISLMDRTPVAKDPVNVIGNSLLWIWVAVTIFSQVGMITNYKSEWPDALALGLWLFILLFAIAAPVFYPQQATTQVSPVSFLYPILTLGWPLVNFIDMIFLMKAKRE